MPDVKLTVLSLESETALNGNITYCWLPYHETWGAVELKTARNIFSAVAMSAATVEITLRPQTITLRNSILWNGKQLFITAIDTVTDRHSLKLTAVLIAPVSCAAAQEVYGLNDLRRRVKTGSVTLAFPAYLTEKYLGRTQNEPQVTVEIQYVLITPKVIELKAGETVAIDGEIYTVWLAHTLDDNKNEYEITRKEEA